ncbi:MAG: NAD(P)/FAD-dependent oxidoreductase [Candidatus Tectomicrobia bacterium]|nr:NAD(P)/FAD-dependent oxidoreductase [Candidatus Tectomicrobia bacterium]
MYDAIIVGGGHNGLVASNYLAKAGLKVLILERRDLVGGACVTEELFPGHRISSCSYICYLLQEKVIDDLQLRKHGFEVYRLDPTRFHPFPDGKYTLGWHDEERNLEEIRRLSPHDAKAYPDWVAFWERAAGILHPYFLTSPPTVMELASRVRGTPDEEVLETMLTMSMRDLIDEFFESEHLRASFIQAHDVGDPNAPGSIFCNAYYRCSLFSADDTVGIPKGGMGGITQAMARSAQAEGVEIQTGVEVEKILIENGKALGVVLKSGEEIRSKITISNADPKRTFLKLVDPEHLDSEFIKQIVRLRTNTAYLKFHAALKELPDFSAYLGEGFDPKCLASIRICPSVDYFEQSWIDAKGGRPSRYPVMAVQIPSVYDPTLAPPGHHVMSIWVLYAPVQLRERKWDDVRQQVGEHLIDTLAIYAPNIKEAMIDWVLFTPADLERRVGLTDGNIRHLDIIPSQFLAHRPLSQWTQYKTPISALYLCGGGTHPGGEVTGAPGHNAAHAILREWEAK